MSIMQKAMAAAMIVMLAGTGCQYFKTSTSPADDVVAWDDGAEAVTEGRFGIPIPSYLSFDRGRSFTFENDDVRIAKLVYEGKGQVAEVANFFNQQLPGDGWKPGNVIEHDEVKLSFSDKSAGEEIEISILQSGRSTVLVRILLVPSGPSRIGSL
jgi:hypothetical protein